MRFAEFERLWEEKGKPTWPLATVIAKHTGVEGAGAAWFADRLHSHGVMNGYRVYSRAKDIEALRELDVAIAKIQRLIGDDGPLTSLAYERLFMELFHGGHGSNLSREGVEADSEQGKALLNHIEEKGRSDSDFIFMVEERGDAIRAAIKRTVVEVESSPMTRVSATKINESEIALVDAARFIWQLATDTDAPAKDLNLASPFGEFLADVFEVYEMAGEPRSAFRAWARECERGHQSLDRRLFSHDLGTT